MQTENKETIDIQGLPGKVQFEMHECLVIGSGAAGLNAAIQLRRNGIDDLLILTEGLDCGTSINTGSDKQTYYKLSMCGADADSPSDMAETYFSGGSMHGDIALVEGALSARAFMNLVELGVPFPRDEYGQFVGYKTDHDPRRRATSIGPYTSRSMCLELIREVRGLGIPILEDRLVVKLLEDNQAGGDLAGPSAGSPGGSSCCCSGDEGTRYRSPGRVAGVIAVTGDGSFEAYGAPYVVFAVGGPGGLYEASVYPEVHTGSIGVALEAGAAARNLPESQFGLASTAFRWNVSGSFMQVIPRFISISGAGSQDDGGTAVTSTASTGSEAPAGAREFLTDYFENPGLMHSMVFLKGYQWPFDSGKARGGSSLIDILVYIETVLKGRRVFLDFRQNPEGFDPHALSGEAREYLEKSGCLQAAGLESPLSRLMAMNPAAVELYAEHGIDLKTEALEVAVCAQHNNGGLAAGIWWESENLPGLFPVGEVNGSHGVYRPGGAALNSGQVGGIRAAEYIAACGRRNRAEHGSSRTPGSIDNGSTSHSTQDRLIVRENAVTALAGIAVWLSKCRTAGRSWEAERRELRKRMSRAGAHVREAAQAIEAVQEAQAQYARILCEGCGFTGPDGAREALRTRQLCYAHVAYLDAVRFSVESGAGSRGSSMVLSSDGSKIHEKLAESWRMQTENGSFRDRVLETIPAGEGIFEHHWVPRRPIPDNDPWFETIWARFSDDSIYH